MSQSTGVGRIIIIIKKKRKETANRMDGASHVGLAPWFADAKKKKKRKKKPRAEKRGGLL